MAIKILLTLFVVFVLVVASMSAKASQTPVLNDRDVVCATLAYNAGYTELGAKFAALVDPYWKTQQVYIVSLSEATVNVLADNASQQKYGTLAESARFFFKKTCQEA